MARRIATEHHTRRVVLTGIPPVDYTLHRVEVTVNGDVGPEVWVAIDRQADDTAPDRVGVELRATTLVSVGSSPNGARIFQATPATLRALAGALLGAIAEAERVGLIATVEGR